MRAAVLTEFGKSPTCRQFEEPVPDENEVLVHVRAAAITPLSRRMTKDTDYRDGRAVPFVCGAEGVGFLDDGTRVGFGVRRAPFGAIAERAVAPRLLLFPVPDALDDVAAAAAFNPAMSSWIPLAWRMSLPAGATVLVLGATGSAGNLAVQIATLLGAGRVVAVGRDAERLRTLRERGADVTISLEQSDEDVMDEIAAAGQQSGYDVVLDYLWGRPAEMVLDALPRSLQISQEIHYVQIGNNAGDRVTLSGNALRRAGVTLVGSGAFPPMDFVQDAYQKIMTNVASGRLVVDHRTVRLDELEKVWDDPSAAHRYVVVPTDGERR